MTIGWATTLVILLTLPNSLWANELILSQVGNDFTLNVDQDGNNHSITFDVDGNNNTANITQTGSDKTMILDFEGNPHNFNGTQTGSGNHYVYIDINTPNNRGTAQINSTQTGSTSQSYTITGTCSSYNGCALNVTQTGN